MLLDVQIKPVIRMGHARKLKKLTTAVRTLCARCTVNVFVNSNNNKQGRDTIAALTTITLGVEKMSFLYLAKSFQMIWQYNRLWFFSSLFIYLISGLFPLATLWITKELINDVLGLIQGNSRLVNSVLVLLLLQFLIAVAQSVTNNLKELLNQFGQVHMDYHLGKKVSEKANSVPYAYFDLPEFYNHLDRISGNYGNRIMSPIQNVMNMLQSVVSLMSYLGFLLFIHWSLVVLSLLAAIPILWVESRFGNAKFYLMRFQTPAAREANYSNALLQDSQSAKEVRLFGLGSFLLERWSDLFLNNNRNMLKLLRKEKTAYIGLDMSTALLYGGAAGVAIWLLKISKLQVGGFVAMTQAIRGAQTSINMVASDLARIYEEQLYIEDLFKFLEFESPAVKVSNAKKELSFPRPFIQGITFEDVSFKYPKSETAVLDHVHFTIKPGEKVAIVGENGSGKTTLVKCLMGLYSVTEGKVCVDGRDIESIPFEDLRSHMTVIFQDFMRYAYTVHDNVAFGDIQNYNDKLQVQKASRQSGVDDFVKHFKNGYETKLGRLLFDGEELSGGQWQKIALARALFRDAEIVVLDEPTASLDPQTELEVFNQFNTLTREKTAIFISHRMAAAKMADRILVMKNGRLVEYGNHQELMKYRNEYYKMFQMQAKWYA